MLSKMLLVQPQGCIATSDGKTKKVQGSADTAMEQATPEKSKTLVADVSRKGSSSNWKKFKNVVAEIGTEKRNGETSNHHHNNNHSQTHSHSHSNSHSHNHNRSQSHGYGSHKLNSNNCNRRKYQNLKPPPCKLLGDVPSNIPSQCEITDQIAMDCEMVGIGNGGVESMIARVSIVNRYGFCLYDEYVKPRERITDFRTAVSGIQPHHLENGEVFEVVQQKVATMLKGRILVGHALKHDLAVLFLSHPRKDLRDTSRYKTFLQVSKGNTPSLKKLAAELLGISIQTGEHNSVEDAKTAMSLYVLYKKQWEHEIKRKRRR